MLRLLGVAITLSLLVATPALAATRRVGSGLTFSTVRAAVLGDGSHPAASPGDSIVIYSGTYALDHFTSNIPNLHFVGVGSPKPIMDGQNNSMNGVDNNKGIWTFTTGAGGTTIDNIEFMRAKSSATNGAGIRIDGDTPGKFVIQNCYFHDSEMQIMASPESLIVQYCELKHSVYTGNNQHNIYFNTNQTYFLFQFNYSHQASTGHEIKSRAKNTYILYNRIADETNPEGHQAAYDIDIPDCGKTYIIGNVIQQDGDASTDNTTLVSYGAESGTNSAHELYIFNNTFANNFATGGVFINAGQPLAPSDVTIINKNNIFYGNGTETVANTKVGDTYTQGNLYLELESPRNNNAKFLNPSGGDYRLTAASPSPPLDSAVDPGIVSGFPCTPAFMYVYDLRSVARTVSGSALDIGAFEYPSGVPDAAQSFFVPQSGSLATPNEGAVAISDARRCPNDDGTQVLRNAARLKIVVRASDGSPIPGIGAADICVLFNGGTPGPSPGQGFTGAGDDSIIANFQYNQAANCPDVRCVYADGPTDANGVAYITWIGHAASDPPGVVTNQAASRDPLRKWGGYAGDIPVSVLGIVLQGKLTSTSLLGTYTAHVKSLDFVGGRTTATNQGELVNTLDINPVKSAIGNPYQYHMDFDNNGIVNNLDFNLINAHNNHKCNFPVAQ